MTEQTEDKTSYTELDLLAAIVRWQLDADYIGTIAEDLPEGSIADACRQLYGEAGQRFEDLIAEVAGIDATDSDLFDAIISLAELV